MSVVGILVLLSLVAAALAPLWLGGCLLFGRACSERRSVLAADLQSILLFILGVSLAIAYFAGHLRGQDVRLPPPLEFHDYQWIPVFVVDGVSIAYFSLVCVVYPAIVRFSIPAFHREPGAARYWFLVTLLAFALLVTTLAGNLDVLFVGWELVGLCSVQLIAFFRTNPRSGENSLRALVYYRICDAALLGALVWLHSSFPTAEFQRFHEDAGQSSAPIVGFLILFASLAKSAQLPMSPWLHRAMEGPAASSAIFYGALSIHLGPLLLLRTYPLWANSASVLFTCAAIGGVTALYATLVGRARPDAKTSLAYAAMAQLGVIYVEIALGWHTLALVHVWAHAGMRTWQFLRSSSLIQDFQSNPLVGAHVRGRLRRGDGAAPLTARWRRALQLDALRLFWIDALQWHIVARPWLGLWRGLESLEERCLARGRGRSQP